MNDPSLAAAVRARMQQIRDDIDQDVEDMVESARNMVDWKHYVKTYPWVCLGTAFALGFLIVPKRSTARQPDLAILTATGEDRPSGRQTGAGRHAWIGRRVIGYRC